MHRCLFRLLTSKLFLTHLEDLILSLDSVSRLDSRARIDLFLQLRYHIYLFLYRVSTVVWGCATP